MSTNILIIIGESGWTQRALHLACAMGRETDSAVIILKMIRVHHLEYLGAGVREPLFSYDEAQALQAYAKMADAYGVPVIVEHFEYVDYSGGLLSAADQLSPLAVFAPAPDGLIANLRLWWLRRMMRRPLYTLGDSDGAMVSMKPAAEAAPISRAGVGVR